ncbi:MAG: quinone-interacting membrane-bound oxidoreductase complex subunit QmoC [Planctomycetota bacterium]
METAEQTSQNDRKTELQESLQIAPAPSEDGKPVWVEPDLDFIRALGRQAGDSLKKCFQCGTCSATCGVSPDPEPFPRKEMAWATWGMKDRLLEASDVWLCHQCNDCSTRCPRGARPGDVLGAVRQECVRHYAVPRFLGRWVSQPHCIPLLLGIPAALLTLGLVLRDPIENLLGMQKHTGEGIVYAYSNLFPHWMLNTFFGVFSILVLVAVIAGIRRFWRAMKAAVPRSQLAAPAKSLIPSIVATLKSIVAHNKFALCTQAHSRFLSHLCVFFGFIALSLVTIWVITARYNPLIQGDFVYPFSFWNPWKILANVGGAALALGCLLMMRDRLRDPEQISTGSYFDWLLISKLLLVVITGYITEVLHYLRLEPHRHIAYFVHLVFVFTVLMYLPYSKLAHLAYRCTAMVFAEHSGRNGGAPTSLTEKGYEDQREEKDNVADVDAKQ